MYEKVKLYTDKYRMFDGTTGVVVGVSGGADSVCLLLLLDKISRREGFPLTAVHVEHGIRGEESLSDAAFVEGLCRNLGVAFKTYSVDAVSFSKQTGQTLEEAARRLRYGCFEDACGQLGADRVAVAHNADDCAETMLFNLVRGTGIRGVCGIRPVSPMPVFPTAVAPDDETEGSAKGVLGDTALIRPLLPVTGEEIRRWLKDMGQPWREDSTNSDISYSRNRIRVNIMPELKSINSRAVLHMADAAGEFREICDFLDEAACEAGKDAFRVLDGDDGKRSVEIYCDEFLAIQPVLGKHLLIHLIGQEAGSRKDITSGHVSQVLDLVRGVPGRRASLPGGMEAVRNEDRVILCRGDGDEPVREEAFFAADLNISGFTEGPGGLVLRAEVLDFTEFSQNIPKKRYTKWFDYDKIKNTVQLRGRLPGDYLQTTGQGGHRKLRQYFKDAKIPASERNDICLLADGDHIMWVVGYRISEAYKVTEGTKRVLRVEAVLPDS